LAPDELPYPLARRSESSFLIEVKLVCPPPETRIALEWQYKAKALLTPSEAKFHQVLMRQSLPGRIHLLCKPRLADFLDSQKDLTAFNKISQKHVDFLVCRPTDWMPMLGIELDDDSHEKAAVKRRDAFVNTVFAQVGIPLLRIHVRELEEIPHLVSKLSHAWLERSKRLAL
jgi:hypothetical protein